MTTLIALLAIFMGLAITVIITAGIIAVGMTTIEVIEDWRTRRDP